MTNTLLSVLLLSLAAGIHAQRTCEGAGPPADEVVAPSGIRAYVLANGLTKPRGIAFDKDDNLLVVEEGKGVTALKFEDSNGCLSLASKKSVVNNANLNHGIDLTPDGNELFASGKEAVWSWMYSSKEMKVTGSQKTRVSGMDQSGHKSRTLLLSKKAPGTLLVSRGSGPNIDVKARDIKTGVSQIRSFDITSPKEYRYTDGKVIGWGLRNSVGLGENPEDGGIWSNENSSDKMLRDGQDIHENSPGEEINFHGTLSNSSELHGRNYGYPECAAVWETANVPRASQLRIGMQFTFASTTSGIDDDTCAKKFVPPRITLPSHWAPLDIEFNSKGSVAYMTSHGSWNKNTPDGYKLFAISFEKGQPTHQQTSKNAAIPILTKKTLWQCGNPFDWRPCFRPVGVAFDSKGRLFLSSDGTGEIWVISKADGSALDGLGAKDVEALR